MGLPGTALGPPWDPLWDPPGTPLGHPWKPRGDPEVMGPPYFSRSSPLESFGLVTVLAIWLGMPPYRCTVGAWAVPLIRAPTTSCYLIRCIMSLAQFVAPVKLALKRHTIQILHSVNHQHKYL